MPRKNPIPAPPPFDLDDIPEADLGFAASRNAETQLEEPVTEVLTGVIEDKEPEVPTPIRALQRADASDHHVVVGMAKLAAMTDEEFERNLAVMEKGQARLRTIQEKLLVAGEDYGRVKGIDKPFLHQPGAEKLANFYGLAVRQEVERLVRKEGDDPDVPPFAFVTKSYVHLGDFSGPVVATGSGEANPFEEKYRYRWTKPACPVCGKTDTIITRKTPPQLAGKRQCAAFGNKGGCGTVFEANDPRLGPAGKEENPDLWGLAETILAMSAKRSMVAAVRRATGTSGLFTQDPDSPSVIAQSDDAPSDNDAPPPVVETAPAFGPPIGPGAKHSEATQVQHERLKVLAKEKGLNGAKIAEVLNRLFGMEVEPTGKAASDAVRTLDADKMGNLLTFIDVGDLSSIGAEADPGFPDDM